MFRIMMHTGNNTKQDVRRGHGKEAPLKRTSPAVSADGTDSRRYADIPRAGHIP